MVCKGHLSISCSTKEPSGLTHSLAQTIRLPSDMVRMLNGQLRSSAMLAKKILSSGLSQTCNVLDLSQVPVLGLLLVGEAVSRRLTWMPNQDSKAFVSAFVEAHKLGGSVSTATELDTLCKGEGGKYDVLIIDSFEFSGLLRHGVLEDVALLRYVSVLYAAGGLEVNFSVFYNEQVDNSASLCV
ncbi:hypothetical protein IscW_ISCW015820 [Ixodes scapularis]|uniref:Uncharacterized protein n=1 Tax=Ixodes scapularis TaxID=6945 RepID=B7P3A4_IXOSC|nr:hypothetical protein IscW_ISCW015820 [Ixodes scapularis]|eukprot:XP_002403789.1 hypothetical protein IscW_ISCW015820 [Ixodes scapularis]